MGSPSDLAKEIVIASGSWLQNCMIKVLLHQSALVSSLLQLCCLSTWLFYLDKHHPWSMQLAQSSCMQLAQNSEPEKEHLSTLCPFDAMASLKTFMEIASRSKFIKPPIWTPWTLNGGSPASKWHWKIQSWAWTLPTVKQNIKWKQSYMNVMAVFMQSPWPT